MLMLEGRQTTLDMHQRKKPPEEAAYSLRRGVVGEGWFLSETLASEIVKKVKPALGYLAVSERKVEAFHMDLTVSS